MGSQSGTTAAGVFGNFTVRRSLVSRATVSAWLFGLQGLDLKS